MINRDYILRLAEQIGRELSILLRLRKRDMLEEELVSIDELLFKKTGLTSSFINSLPEELLLQALSPLGTLNIEACLWIAGLLKEEGEIYKTKGDETQSYYRYIKSLYLFLEALYQEHIPDNLEFHQYVKDLLLKLQDYELPIALKDKIFRYYEQSGHYAQAENILFEMVEGEPTNTNLFVQGQDFYQRLEKKSDADLLAGDFSREEIQEGREQLLKLQR